MASLAKRPNLRSFGAVAVRASVGSTVAMWIAKLPNECCVRVTENRDTFMEQSG